MMGSGKQPCTHNDLKRELDGVQTDVALIAQKVELYHGYNSDAHQGLQDSLEKMDAKLDEMNHYQSRQKGAIRTATGLATAGWGILAGVVVLASKEIAKWWANGN